MAYKFFFPSSGETLDKSRDFKTRVDLEIAKAKTLTFVGWRPDTGVDAIQYARMNGQNVTVIEIFEPNCRVLASTNLARVVCGDVRDFDKLLRPDEMEVLIWQDGPEHLEMKDSVETLNRAKRSFKAIVIGTPDGVYEQGEIDGNIHEAHLSAWYVDDYRKIDFDVRVVDQSGFLVGLWVKNKKDDGVCV